MEVKNDEAKTGLPGDTAESIETQSTTDQTGEVLSPAASSDEAPIGEPLSIVETSSVTLCNAAEDVDGILMPAPLSGFLQKVTPGPLGKAFGRKQRRFVAV